MGYFMVHLKVAEKLFTLNEEIEDKSAFYKGSLAPDAIMFREGCKRSDKELTHFCVGDEGWGYYTNCEDWRNNLIQNIKNYRGKIQEDFLLGYLAHVCTDILYTEQIWTPNRLIKEATHIDRYLEDCYEIDSRLFESLEDKKDIWSLLENTQDYWLSNILIKGDMENLINEMANNMYKDRKVNLTHEFNAITISDMLQFIEEAVEKINELWRVFL